MPRGRYPREYFHNPDIQKPVEMIYDDIDGYTGEFFENETHLHQWVNFMVVVPPVYYEGHFIRGLFMSQGIDLIMNRYPKLKRLFIPMAYSMWSSYPWAQHAEIFLTCFDNPDHAAYYRRKHPTCDKQFIPLLDTDYTNEYVCAPRFVPEKDIDILCVARMHDLKNLPRVARSLKIYEKKYGKRLKAVFVVGKEFDLNLKGLDEQEREQLRQIDHTVGHRSDYIELVPKAEYFTEMQTLFARSKIYTLASLIEGKNRGLYESQMHNVPAVVYEAHNQWGRGPEPIFPGASGLTCAYDEEAMADAWHEVFAIRGELTPRKNIMSLGGRKRFVHRCLQDIPYYQQCVPTLAEENPYDGMNNLWLDLAIQDNYQISYHDFIYDRNPTISNFRGVDSIEKSLSFYFARFRIENPKEPDVPVEKAVRLCA